MTAREVIARLAAIKPHSYDDAVVTGWLKTLEGLLWHELLCRYEGYDEPEEQGADAPLLVPEPYAADVYTHYLAAQVDYANAEYARYNNATAMYHQALSRFADWLTREGKRRAGPCIDLRGR